MRFVFHVDAFGALAANPFPGFTGMPGSYPLDLVLPGPERQNRWKTLFRLFLSIPASILSVGLLGVARRRGDPDLVRRARSPAALPRGSGTSRPARFATSARLNAYLYLLTDRVPAREPARGRRARAGARAGAMPTPELIPAA